VEKKIKTKKTVEINKWSMFKLIVVLILFSALIYSHSINEYIKEKKFENKEQETVYCHFKTVINDTAIKREECKNMKIVSKELERINLSQFDNLKDSEFFCTENYEEVPQCENENFYMSRYTLDLFTNTSIDGYTCITYQINFTTDNTKAIMMHLNLLMQERFDNLSDQTKAFEECEFNY